MKKILILIAALALLGCDKYSQSSKYAYSGWCKYYNRTDITIDEWVSMRNLRVLPGMTPQNNNSSGLATGIATGAIIGSSMAAGRR